MRFYYSFFEFSPIYLPRLPFFKNNIMFKFKNGVELRNLLSKNKIQWLLLIDYIPPQLDKNNEQWLWECAEEVLLEDKGDNWKDAVYIHSNQALELLEDAIKFGSFNKIYLNNTLIQKK